MTESHFLIDDLVDGEPVDPARLAEALADPDARQYLADVLVLRGLVRNEPGAEAAGARARTTAPWRLRLVAAAAVLVTGALGFGLGWRAAGERPPPGSRTNTPGVISISAPEPSAVITLEPGVDWDERRW